MSDVTPINGTAATGLNRLNRPSQPHPVGEAGPARSADQVELSRAATYLSKLLNSPEVRHDLVDRVRQEIDSGSYETPEKVEALLDELIADL